MGEIDWSEAPEGATHWGPRTEVDDRDENWTEAFYKLADGVKPLYSQDGKWREGCDDNYDWDSRLESLVARLVTPTLETMLAEWRDLEARAQAAQAEADALFEHAGQCHGEIVVRLAELGWGAPRGPMVPGEPVVTLDDSDGWIEWNGSKPLLNSLRIVDIRTRDGDEQCGYSVNNWDWSHDNHPRDIVAYRVTPSTQP